MSDQPSDRPDAEQRQEAPERSYAGPYETGPLGEPIDEPIPRGTLILLGLFLVVLVLLWLYAYLAVFHRGVS
ncbi:hypothetical protein [Sphaerobacter sp.]|uniref:hypothetical protein n=1 Tax=Sphaerobacter sp. TaxID=2099654 RepID=UPI001DDE85F4|nr:hypothetical protein [Sphaerobacter sp.]MBX5444421.1 hypothetical protein [Sphaerobacter sp.]